MLKLSMCAALVLMAVDCGGRGDGDEAEEAAETTELTSNESALMAAAAEDVTSSTAGSLTDDQIAEAAKGRLLGRMKSGCTTATRAGNVVTYVMTECTGPRGLVKVSGTMVVTYTRQSDGSIKAAGSGTGIKVNDGTVDLKVTAVYSRACATGIETAVVDTEGNGTGPRGHTAERVGHYTVVRDPAGQCLSLDGNWSTKFDGARATAKTEVTGVKKCAGECPAAGGTVTHTGVLGKVTTLSFDGSATASWSRSDGKSGTVALQCR